MSYNFDNSSFSLDQAGLELSLNDFSFDPTQATQVQQHLQQQHLQQQQQQLTQHQEQQQRQQQQQQQQRLQQDQRQLQNLLLQNEAPNNRNDSENRWQPQQQQHQQQQQIMDDNGSSHSRSTLDYHPSASMDLLAAAVSSAGGATTPILQTHPEKSSRPGVSLQQQLQQQHQQQQLLLQQQQQRQQEQLRQQQQQQLQLLPQSTPQQQQQQQNHVQAQVQAQARVRAQVQAQAQAQQMQNQTQNQNQNQQKEGGPRGHQLLTPAGSEYYSSGDFSQYMSPLGIQPENTNDSSTMVLNEQFDDDEQVFFTPLISPAMTPVHPYSNMPQAMSTSNEIFSPLSSPALQPHRSSQIDYLSFTGPNFSSLPIQFQQAHQAQQQQLQQQLQQFQQPQQQFQQPQGVSSDSLQPGQTTGAKHHLTDTKSPALNGQRPPVKRRTTVERSTNGLTVPNLARTSAPGGNGVNSNAMSKSFPALQPMLSHAPSSPSNLRSQPTTTATMTTPTAGGSSTANTTTASRPRTTVTLAPASPMTMHFPTNNRPTPSPIMLSTTQPMVTTPGLNGQPSPSPRLVSHMNHLSMMPASPALFALPASSMMPPPPSPMTLPSQQSRGQERTQRQLSISIMPAQNQTTNSNSNGFQLIPQKQQQQQHPHPMDLDPAKQPSLQPSVQSNPGSSTTLQSSIADQNTSAAAVATGSGGDTVMAAPDRGTKSTPKSLRPSAPSSNNSSPSIASTTNTPKSALAPVTPASLMNLSGSETTPTSSPKFGAGAKSKSKASTKSTESPTSSSATMSGGSKSSSASSSGKKGGSSGSSHHRKSVSATMTAGPIMPRTPGTMAAFISPMPPPASGFPTLISPALKPTLMPQPISSRGHRNGSIGGSGGVQQPILMSPRGQPLLVSPGLKPWLPGVSTSEVMARLASKSNYQNILDGDHTALGLSYNTDLHSGIELRRTSHKAAEQKRRDSLKHCFEDLRQMIPNIQEKAPSKVFLLKKSFDYICALKAEIAQRDLTLARCQVQQDFMERSMTSWFESTFQDEENNTGENVDGEEDGGKTGTVTLTKDQVRQSFESWRVSETQLLEATRKEMAAAQLAVEVAEQSALAIEAARIGNQQEKEKEKDKESGGKPTSSSGKHVKGSQSLGNQTQKGRDINTGGMEEEEEEDDDDESSKRKQGPTRPLDKNSHRSQGSESGEDSDSEVLPQPSSSSSSSSFLKSLTPTISKSKTNRNATDPASLQSVSSSSKRRRKSLSAASSRSNKKEDEGDDDDEGEDEDDEDEEEEGDDEEEYDEDEDDDEEDGRAGGKARGRNSDFEMTEAA